VVRDALGVAMSAIELPRPWLVANVIDHGEPGHVVIRCRARGAAVTMPLPHGFRRVEVELSDDDNGALLHDEVRVRRELSRGWSGAKDAEIVTKAIARFRYAVADQWRLGRVFLAGDAAHQMPPFAGQGLGAGLRDASNLAFKIAGVTQGWLSSEALDSYEEERRPHVEKILSLVQRLGRLMTPASDMCGTQSCMDSCGARRSSRGWESPGNCVGPRSSPDSRTGCSCRWARRGPTCHSRRCMSGDAEACLSTSCSGLA
jgi:3-(3-hydroxy-phenyl)propionate hydroxylase